MADTKEKRWLRVLAAVLLPIFLFIMTPTLGIWSGVVREGQAATLITTVLSKPSAQESLAGELADSLISGMDKKTRAQAKERTTEIKAAVAERLADPAVQEKFSGIADQVVAALASGAGSVTIDPKPLIDELVASINSIQGIEKISSDDLGDIKPATLGSAAEPLPDLSGVFSAIRTVAITTFLFVALCIFVIARTSRTPLRGVALPILVLGLIWTLAQVIGSRMLVNQLEPGIQADLIPILASQVLAGIRAISISSLLAGLILLVAHFILARRVDAPKGS